MAVHGATLTWNGGGGANGNWNDSANWGGAGIPVTGDILVFQGTGGLNSTNNISGLTLNQIRFNTGGFVLYGDAFTLTNSIMATNTSGANTIANSITLAVTNVVIAVSNGVTLTMSGILSGSVGVTKSGSGALTYQAPGSNLYTGQTFVSAGTLQLNVSGVSAFLGPLVIGDGSGTGAPMVENLQSIEMDYIGPVTINSAGTLNLNNFSDNINTNITLAGGTIETGTGSLSLPANSTITSGNGFDSFIDGNLYDGNGGTLTIQGSGLLFIEANVSGTANIVQSGEVETYWSGANTFSGNYTDNSSGYLDLVSSQALGNPTNSLTLNGQAWAAIGGPINLTNSSVTINSTFTGGALYSYDVTNSWTASFVLDQACTIAVFTNCALSLNGPISGSGGFTKYDPGTLTLSGTTPNTYSGTTTVNGGTLLLGKPYNVTAIPGPLILDTGTEATLLNSWQIYNPATPVTIYDNASLNLGGYDEWVGPITLQGGQITTAAGILYFSSNVVVNASSVAQSVISGSADIWNETCTMTNSGHNFSPDLVITATLTSNGGGVIKTGAGEISLTGLNTFSGPTTINQGDLWAGTSQALGNTNTPVTVNNGATLFLDGSGLDFGLKPLVLSGSGYAFGAVLYSGSSSWEGNVTLAANSQIYGFNNSTLTLAGSIGGPGGFTEAGTGELILGGSIANTFAGEALINSGTLVLSNSAAIAIPGTLDIYGTVQLAENNQTAESSDVIVESGGQFLSGPYYSFIDKLQGSGVYSFGANGYVLVGVNNGSSEFDGSFTGAGYAPGYTVGKFGSGIFTIGGNSSYTAGITHIYEGKLVVNGSQPSIPVTVEGGTTLAGSGSVGPITDYGTVSPGNTVGVLNSGNAIFNSGGDFTVGLAGPNPGFGGYSQLNVNGTVDLTNTTLTVIPEFTTAVASGQQFTIINNNLTYPVVGTFSGLPEGAAMDLAGYDFTISYVGGSGNDVVLTLTNVPASVVSASVSAGNGSHTIDPNDCNSLNLVITNTSGSATALNSVSATLSTTTEGVLITQPYSDYGDIAAGGKATNDTPFQISTLPTFDCGTEIDLQLTVNANGSSFTTPFVLSSGSPAESPFRYDDNTSAALPLNGTLDSTNYVSDFVGFPLEKVTVSLWITNSNDADLTNITLIAPDGATVLLSSANGGSGKSYGVAASPDSNRTTFDDAASTFITNGVAPFVGTFIPQSPLAAFAGDSLPNGPWHLHIANAGSTGTLEAWSLFLYPVGCADGGGACDVCHPVISDAITAASAVQTNRWNRDEVVSSCGAPKNWSGFGDLGISFHYNAYTFTNTSGADACVTIELQSTNDLMAATYLGGYDATTISDNFLGDAGISTAQADGDVTTYSTEIPNGMKFVVVVNEVTQNSGTQPYILSLSGLPCQPPTLSIQSIPRRQVHLYWPTWAGGYTLQASPLLSAPIWANVTNEPITVANQFNVTNTINPTIRFYRLQKP